MLCNRYNLTTVQNALLPHDQWHPFPPAKDRRAWETLIQRADNLQRRAYVLGAANASLNKAWPDLPASFYMEFIRSGDRTCYERPYYERRARLGELVVAECFEHSGRYIDAIVDGLWLICDESTWCLPAHAQFAEAEHLPDVDCPTVDLFAAETAMGLSDAVFLLRDELSDVSRAVVRRVEKQVMARVVEPVEQREDIWWFSGQNNWTPWCSSNVLGAAMHLVHDTQRLAKLCWKLMQAVDRYLEGYSNDGGCDEGPSYWNVGPGALLIFLELLYERTGGRITLFDKPKICAIGQFLAKVHLDGPWFAAFADAEPRLVCRSSVIHRLGQRLDDDSLKAFATLAAHQWREDINVPVMDYHRASAVASDWLRAIVWSPANNGQASETLAQEIWFDQLQCLVARETTEANTGLVLAAKGGHNGENHNHNDVGQFMVYLDGRPGIVDVGRETYKRTTFNDLRYTIWCNRGSGHNTPVVNGFEQVQGRQRQAKEVRYAAGNNHVELSMRLEAVFPDEAELVELKRTIRLERGDNPHIVVRDHYKFSIQPGELTLNFYAAAPATLDSPGLITLAGPDRRLVIAFDPGQFIVNIERLKLQDPFMQNAWGSHLWKLVLVHQAAALCGEYALRFSARPVEKGFHH